MLTFIYSALAAPWEQVDDPTFASLGQWTHEVELGDLDADGDLDVILANGGDYARAGEDEPSWWLQNDGTGAFVAVELVVGQHRTAKIRDFDGDQVPDVFLPGAWQTPSVLLLGDGSGGLQDGSAGLPPELLSVGDAEPGDVDGDGDLDLVLTDSGAQNALTSPGEVTRLWLNDGAGLFVDATDARMPQVPVRWSWDIELMDIDLDLDLDLLISCKTCTGSMLFTNDGTGTFTDRSASGLPGQRTNNYDFESLDLTGDGLPDLVTINDGPQLGERILVNDQLSAFVDETASRLPPSEDLGEDDNVLVLLDPDNDADVDVLIGSLSGPDRLLVNDGTGHFTVDTGVLQGINTPGTLGLAAGDLDGDGRLDLVMAQGEVTVADRWYRGVDIEPDSQPPVVGAPVGLAEGPVSVPALVQVQAHDRKTPIVPDDLQVVLEWTIEGVPGSLPLLHAGGAIWRARLESLPPGTGTARTCATDRAGNTACSEEIALGGEQTAPVDTGEPDTGVPQDTASEGSGEDKPSVDDPQGCGCHHGAPASTAAAATAASLLLALRSRRRVSPALASG